MHEKLRKIIFGIDTPAGRRFDIILLWIILASVTVVMLESVRPIYNRYHQILASLEWFFTIVFSVEYLLRVYSAENRWKYITSFYGLIDLLSTIPSYIGIFVSGAKPLLILRAFRFLRIFRILNISKYNRSSRNLVLGLRASKNKIIVFMIAVLTVVMIIGALMYIIEGEEHGFNSIPHSIYWAIVTITTVGYGDISPETPLGQFLASALMLIGYAIIAVPSGIITSAAIMQGNKNEETGIICPRCKTNALHPEANFCYKCGEKLDE